MTDVCGRGVPPAEGWCAGSLQGRANATAFDGLIRMQRRTPRGCGAHHIVQLDAVLEAQVLELFLSCSACTQASARKHRTAAGVLGCGGIKQSDRSELLTAIRTVGPSQCGEELVPADCDDRHGSSQLLSIAVFTAAGSLLEQLQQHAKGGGGKGRLS